MKLSKTMVRLLTFSGMIAVVAVVAVLLASLSPSGKVQAAQESGNCRVAQVAVDDGYGVSGMATLRICE